MEKLYDITSQALNRYFTILEKTGYIKDADVNKLLLLSFITDFLQEYKGYITEDDYRIISEIVACLTSSSCLIPYVQYQQMSVPVESYISNVTVRTSEQEDLRSTESEYGLRLVNQ